MFIFQLQLIDSWCSGRFEHFSVFAQPISKALKAPLPAVLCRCAVPVCACVRLCECVFVRCVRMCVCSLAWRQGRCPLVPCLGRSLWKHPCSPCQAPCPIQSQPMPGCLSFSHSLQSVSSIYLPLLPQTPALTHPAASLLMICVPSFQFWPFLLYNSIQLPSHATCKLHCKWKRSN